MARIRRVRDGGELRMLIPESAALDAALLAVPALGGAGAAVGILALTRAG
jgi:hypothetical protein